MYVCMYRKPYSHYQGSHEVLNCMRFFRFVYSTFCLKDIVTYIEGKRFSNSSDTDSSSLLIDYYISYSIPLVIKDTNCENTRPMDSCILKKNMNIATYCSIQPSPAESLTLTLATERDAKHPLQNYLPY